MTSRTLASSDLEELVQTAPSRDAPAAATHVETATAADLKAELLDAAARIAAKDNEIAAIKRRHASELAEVIARSHDVNALDEAVASRIAVIDAAKAILGVAFDPNGKSDVAIRRFVAEQKLGEARLAGKDDDYIAIVFDTLVNTAVNTVPFEASVTPALQKNYAIEAYTAQMATSNRRDMDPHGHPDVERAIRLSSGWIHHGVEGRIQHPSHL